MKDRDTENSQQELQQLRRGCRSSLHQRGCERQCSSPDERRRVSAEVSAKGSRSSAFEGRRMVTSAPTHTLEQVQSSLKHTDMALWSTQSESEAVSPSFGASFAERRQTHLNTKQHDALRSPILHALLHLRQDHREPGLGQRGPAGEQRRGERVERQRDSRAEGCKRAISYRARRRVKQ
jgi:hypothetical protein